MSNSEFLRDVKSVLSVSEVAEIVGASASTIRAEIHRHKLIGVRVGRRIVVPKYRLIAYLDRDEDFMEKGEDDNVTIS